MKQIRMKQYIIPSILLFIFQISCSQENKNNTISEKDSIITENEIKDSVLTDTYEEYYDYSIDSAALGINFSPKGNYINVKNKISSIRIKLKDEFLKTKNETKKQQIIDTARTVFTNYLINEIIPFWYGTQWDFNGYTNTPNKGVIACGYFVSTTLKHMGLNINRYTLAQQAPHNEALTFESDSNLLIFNTDTLFETNEFYSFYTDLEQKLKADLYFVGLYNHVGFLYSKDNKLYFIHSNYINGYVMFERIFNSEAFRSNIYYIADITYNDNLIKKWILNSTVKVNVK